MDSILVSVFLEDLFLSSLMRLVWSFLVDSIRGINEQYSELWELSIALVNDSQSSSYHALFNLCANSTVNNTGTDVSTSTVSARI